jgi:hypothetical protein
MTGTMSSPEHSQLDTDVLIIATINAVANSSKITQLPINDTAQPEINDDIDELNESDDEVKSLGSDRPQRPRKPKKPKISLKSKKPRKTHPSKTIVVERRDLTLPEFVRELTNYRIVPDEWKYIVKLVYLLFYQICLF